MGKKSNFKRIICLMTASLLVLTSLAGCAKHGEVEGNASFSLGQPALASSFAPYNEETVNVKPAVPFYRVADDFSNISNAGRFEFSPDARRLLTANGFVVTPERGAEFFGLYEVNRYDGVPNFVTTDAMMHNYHLFFNHLLKSVEREHLIPALKGLSFSMLEASMRQYQELQGTGWENAARRNVAFFAVGCRLVEPQAQVPAEVRELVEQELALISQHQGFETSPLMNLGQNSPDELEDLKEDYTQYIPRGHYTKSEEFKNYFKAMMWYGRITFRLKNEDETRSAVLMTLALNQGENRSSWEKIYEPTSFFVGKSDDLGCSQYQALLTEVYGEQVQLTQVAGDQAKWQQFMAKAAELKPPAINSIPIFDENIQPDREKEIKGFRFMGQRFTLDASVFQRLIYREVKENSQRERRMLPKGLDIPAAVGSDAAYSLLKEQGDTGYQDYSKNMEKMRSYIAGLDKNTWTQNLYWSWLYTLLPLTEEKPAGYPAFMLNEAWAHKELSTYLGSWTELKHDTILYAKQVYAEMGGGEESYDDRGYVEPNPQLYSRLAALSAMTREGLTSRGLLAERDRVCLERMEQLARQLKDISVKELENASLSAEEYELIRSFGGQLEHFWLEALRDENVVTRSQLWDNQAPVVADVATAPGTVLEEGTGYINSIYVVVPVDGKLRIARGGVFSYYEFPWPMDQRLTDQEWQKMLEEGRAPPQPAWTRSFTAEGSSRAIPSWE